MNNNTNRQLELAKTCDFCASDKLKLTVVFIHGIASDSSSFDGLLKHLASISDLKDVRMICFDLLGVGKSYSSDDINYDFTEQINALYNSIDELKCETPIVLVGHSMGTLVSVRFANLHKRLVRELVLISPPIYREEDIRNPMFKVAMNGFRDVVEQKKHGATKSKVFNDEIKYIVSNTNNYRQFTELSQPTTMIYGELDRIIASHNIPKLLKTNPNIKVLKTTGAHGITVDKYAKVTDVLKKALNKLEEKK